MSQQTKSGLYPEQSGKLKKNKGAGLRLLVLGCLLVGLTLVLFLFRNVLGDGIILILLGILSMLGVFYLIATTIGLIGFTQPEASNDFSYSFVDSQPEGVLVSDMSGQVVYANKAYMKMIGAGSKEELKTPDVILAKENTAADAVYRLMNSARDGISAQEEIRLTEPLINDGSLKHETANWYRVKVRPVNEAMQGHGPLIAWQISDISDERADQEKFFLELQEAIDHLDHAPAGFFSADEAGRIIYLNATLAEWLGIDLGAFIPGSVFISDIVAGNGMALINSVTARPESSRNSVIDLDLTKLSGQSLPVRLYHRVYMSKEGYRGTSRTIVLNRVEGDDSSAALRSSEIRFTRFFNSAPMAIAAVGRDGKTIRTNARFLDILSTMIDKSAGDRSIAIESMVHDRDKAIFSKALADAFTGQAHISPVDTVLSNDEERHIRLYISPVSGIEYESDEEAAIVSVVETTEQKALEGQMAQSQKMQAVGQLAGGIAHDFNNVLTAIMMSSEMLLANHRASDPSFLDIMNIKNNAGRAAALVRQLLAFSRRQTLRPQVLDLTDVLADLRFMLTKLLNNFNINLKIEHGRDLWMIKADIGQFEQVAVNLVVNARDAMGSDGGHITLRTRNLLASEAKELNYRELPPADYVLFEVEDDGAGIPADVLEKIFEPFFTTKEVGKGTGLGLSMVYGIIKQTGGYINCHSEAGVGTTFQIFLPRDIEEPQTALESEQKVKDKKAETRKDLSGSATVLLVEDEDAVRMGGVRALQSRGYTVHEASTGVEALEVLEELNGQVDIIVSDVVMPEMDGPTLLRELRKHYPDIKFIFVSGYAEDAFAKNLPEDAKFGFLPKPFSLKQLATAVKDMLEKQD